MITEPTPIHNGTRGPRARTSGAEAGGGAGAGASTSVSEDHAGAATPQPEATAQPGTPLPPARGAGGPMLAAPAFANDDLRPAVQAAERYGITPGDIETLREFAEHAPAWLLPRIPDGYAMPFGLTRLRQALLAGAEALEEADALRVVETAALALLRASGPNASWGEHSTAERVLRDLLTARGHEVGKATA